MGLLAPEAACVYALLLLGSRTAGAWQIIRRFRCHVGEDTVHFISRAQL
jgi:hypothetical protein